jgi:hypothetical protein
VKTRRRPRKKESAEKGEGKGRKKKDGKGEWQNKEGNRRTCRRSHGLASNGAHLAMVVCRQSMLIGVRKQQPLAKEKTKEKTKRLGFAHGMGF